MCSCLSSTFLWSQHLIVSSPVYTTRKPTLILTWITHHLSLPVVRIPSLTVSFSVYDASAVGRIILKTRGRKWQAFSKAVAIFQMWFSKHKNEYQPSLVTPLFQSAQVWPVLNLPSLWCWRTIPRTQWSKTSWLETSTCCEMTQTLETFTDHYEFCERTVAIIK